MRHAILGVLCGLLFTTACLAQGEPSGPAKYLAQTLDVMWDVEILHELLSLQLREEQLQRLIAIFEQYPRPGINPAFAQDASEKLEQLRARLILGVVIERDGPEEQAMQKALQAAFSGFGGIREAGEKPVTQLLPEENLVLAILTPTQQGVLLGLGGDDAAKNAAARILRIVGRLRGEEAPLWVVSRDRFATCVAAAGAADPRARENSRLVFIDFLNRVRAMSDLEFLEKHTELAVELAILLPPGINLAPVLAEFDPEQVHNALAPLLSPRTPPLVQKMQAARATKGIH